MSAATREGLRDLAFTLATVIAEARAAAPPPEPTRLVLRPEPTSGPEFEVVQTGENTFTIRGSKPVRWIRQTDFSNDEAVGYLADRLDKLGIEEALAKAGAERRRRGAHRPGRQRRGLRLGPDRDMARRVGPRGTDSRVG